jgi:anti-sigma-K factor RskA
MSNGHNSQAESYYSKKIISYIDGALTAEEKSEFEAFVQTHPEFEQKLSSKQSEFALIQSLIPKHEMNPELLESLENEMKQSAFDLLKSTSPNWSQRMKNFWEEWTNR